MAKIKSIFICQSCGAKYPKWQGQCSQCGEWQTLVEEIEETGSGFGVRGLATKTAAKSGKVVMLSELETSSTKQGFSARLTTGSAEFDRVLGGGIVSGSVVLVGGEPGVGKSTLLTQLALQASSEFGVQSSEKAEESPHPAPRTSNILYVCGEESVEQVGLRVRRLEESSKLKAQSSKLRLMAETNVDIIIATALDKKPAIMIIDSIQTLFTYDLSGMAGSVGQIRECSNRLIELAKRHGVAIFIVGHVTKEGTIAGPKVLEHMVDVVIQLEGERTGAWRIARAVKNRFGPTDEVGVFALDEFGLVDVTNPSGAFLEESQAGKSGSAIVSILEGTRPVLIEIQALAVPSQLAMPRRVAHGVSLAKVQLLAAVLQKHCRLPLGNHDLFVNVAGGLKVTDPAADLGIALALVSSLKDVSLPPKSVSIGEVGLLGEIRRVSQYDKRVKEAKKLGYTTVLSREKSTHVADLVKTILAK